MAAQGALFGDQLSATDGAQLSDGALAETIAALVAQISQEVQLPVQDTDGVEETNQTMLPHEGSRCTPHTYRSSL